MTAALLCLGLLTAQAAPPDLELVWTADAWPRVTQIVADPDRVRGGQELGQSAAIVPDWNGDGEPELLLGAFGDALTAADMLGNAVLVESFDIQASEGGLLPTDSTPWLLGSTEVNPVGSHVLGVPDPTSWPRGGLVVGARGYQYGGGLFFSVPDAEPWEDRDTLGAWHGDNTHVWYSESANYFGNKARVCPLGAGTGLVVSASKSSESPCSEGEVHESGSVFFIGDAYADVSTGEQLDVCHQPGTAVMASPHPVDFPPSAGARFGASVACGGQADPTGPWVLIGSNDQCEGAGCVSTATRVPGDIDVLSDSTAVADATTIWHISGDRIRYTHITAGPGSDVDGDGYDDVIIGIPGFSDDSFCRPEASYTGAVAVYYTDPANPFPARIELGPETADLFICGDHGGRYFGRSFAGGADLNGDGLDDLFISDANTLGERREEVYVLYGRTERRTGVFDAAEVVDWTVQLTDLAPDAESEWDVGAHFGFWLELGHLDGDGLADLVITARHLAGYDAVDTVRKRGGAWVLFGMPDLDADGFLPITLGGTDCNDADDSVHPLSEDTLGDGIDSDCNGLDGPSGACVDTDDCDGDGHPTDGGDCDDVDAWTYPGADELRDGLDNNCNGDIDENTRAVDVDGDGYSVDQGDCDDSRADVHPLADEGTVADGVNQDCDLRIDEQTLGYDDDGDGAVEPEDCDDLDPTRRPGLEDLCNEQDDDCDGIIDEDAYVEGWLDADGDGWGDADAPFEGCPAPAHLVAQAGDCDDSDASVAPGLPDPCDGVDNDCDGLVDEDGWVFGWLDEDGDGQGAAAAPYLGCPQGQAVVDNLLDCDDSRPDIFVGAKATPSSEDRDCDGEPDNGRIVGCHTANSHGRPGGLGALLAVLAMGIRRRRWG